VHAPHLRGNRREKRQGRKEKRIPEGEKGESGRAIAVGTVFAWQTREYGVDDITAAIKGLFKAASPSRKSQRGGQASSHQDSSSSLAQRCRFSINLPSIRDTRTSLCGAGPAEAMAGATIAKAPNNAEAMMRLQRFRPALGIFAFF
jgi:hypothetical protein